MGCYQNRGRALGDVLLKVRSSRMSKNYAACVKAANDQGITLFGLDGKNCWSGKNASSYDMYGKSGQCKSNKKRTLSAGFMASGTIFVYQKDNGNLISAHALCLRYFTLAAFSSPESAILLVSTKKSRPLAGTDFLSLRRALVFCCLLSVYCLNSQSKNSFYLSPPESEIPLC